MGDMSELSFTLEWINYPRVRFFKDRYMNLYRRFHNIIDALPECFHDSNLMKYITTFYDDLGQSPKVLVTGVTDITNNDIVVSANKVHKRSSEHNVHVEKADSTDPTVKQTDEYRSNNGPSIFVHFIDIKGAIGADLEERGIIALREIIKKCRILRHTYWSNIIVFRTNETITMSDTEVWANSLQLELQRHSIESHNIHILLNPTKQELPRQISLVFEKRLIDTFIRMFSDLRRFIQTERRYDLEDNDILHSTEIFTSIENILCINLVEISKHESSEQSKQEEWKLSKQEESIDKNDDNIRKWTSSADYQVSAETFVDKIIRNTCHSISCSAVAPLAAKFNLTMSCCQQLLIELQFKDNLIDSISEITRGLLSFRSEEMMMTRFSGTAECTKIAELYAELIARRIQRDVTKEFARVENKLKRMDQVVTAMRKMAFEIKGYLSQSDVARKFEDKMFQSKPISQSLREDIFRIKGVYSVATVYGELEICLTADAVSKAIEDARKILQNHKYNYAHKIKRAKNSLTYYAGAMPLCFEQGDTLLSPNIDKPNESRIGTLGERFQGSDDASYGLTCAHVVESTKGEVQRRDTNKIWTNFFRYEGCTNRGKL